MKRAEFNRFKEYINEYGIESSEVQCAGFIWINCTERQIQELRDIAIEKGYKPDEKGVVKVGIYRLFPIGE